MASHRTRRITARGLPALAGADGPSVVGGPELRGLVTVGKQIRLRNCYFQQENIIYLTPASFGDLLRRDHKLPVQLATLLLRIEINNVAGVAEGGLPGAVVGASPLVIRLSDCLVLLRI